MDSPFGDLNQMDGSELWKALGRLRDLERGGKIPPDQVLEWDRQIWSRLELHALQDSPDLVM